MDSVGEAVVYALQRGIELRKEAQRLRTGFNEERREQLLHDLENYPPGSMKAQRAQAEIQYHLTALQINSAERGGRQLAAATWVLALATLGLFVATIVLATKGG